MGKAHASHEVDGGEEEKGMDSFGEVWDEELHVCSQDCDDSRLSR